jgi:hypothetical protein
MADSITHLWRDLKAADERAKAEREKRNKLLDYDPHHFDSCTHTPVEFYKMVLRNLDWRKVPDLKAGTIWLHEGHVFSRERLYLQLKRERLVFEICAAPFGTGYFVSSRLFDRRRGANAFHYIFACLFLASIGIAVWYRFGWIIGVIATGFLFSTLWSLMRLAVQESAAWLDQNLCEFPVLGPIYESLFHPNTYYREDTNTMYKAVVKKAFKESVSELVKMKGLKITGDESKLFLEKLDER